MLANRWVPLLAVVLMAVASCGSDDSVASEGTVSDPSTTSTAERDFSPACDDPDAVDASQGVAEWEAMSQDYGPFEIPGEVDVWVSDPAGDWDGPFVGNVIVEEGGRDAATLVIRERYLGPLCVVESAA